MAPSLLYINIEMGKLTAFFDLLLVWLCLPGVIAFGAANPNSFGVASRFGITQEQLIDHEKIHRARVVLLAEAARDKYSHRFPGVTKALLFGKVKDHDRSKDDDSPEFYEEVGYSNPKTIPERLYQTFLDTPFQTKAALKKGKALFRTLNWIDKVIGYRYFKDNGLLTTDGRFSEIARYILKLEMIADVVDRGQNPFSPIEFGRPMIKASDLPDLSDEDREIALFLENNYYHITKEIILPSSFTEIQRKTILCLGKMSSIQKSDIH
jgi:hypothetical protein